MSLPLRLAALCAVFALLGCGPAVQADEEEVPLDKMPAKALGAVKALFPKGELKEATKDKDAGGVYYSVTLVDGKTHYEVTVREGGKVIEVAKEVAFIDLPKAVQAAVHKKYPNGKIGEVAELTEPGVRGKHYHVELTTAAGKEVALTYDPTGKLIDEE